MDAQSLIDALRAKASSGAYDQHAVDLMRGLMHQVEDALIADSLKENDHIKKRLCSMQSEIDAINDALLQKRTMSELERLNLIDRRELYLGFIRSFDVDGVVRSVAMQLETLE